MAHVVFAAGNLVSNGDFEAGNVGFESDFSCETYIRNLYGAYAIATDPEDAHGSIISYGDHTSGSGNMLVANGLTAGAEAVWRQTVAIQQNSAYAFSVAVSTWAMAAQLRFEINDAVVMGGYASPSTEGSWEVVRFVWNSGSSSSAKIEIVNVGAEGNDFAIDDIYFGLPINTGLVAYYPFDGNANDESGNGNNGITYGGITYANGKVGQGAHFDGNDDWVLAPSNRVLAFGSADFSTAFWFRTLDETGYMLDARTGPERGFWLVVHWSEPGVSFGIQNNENDATAIIAAPGTTRYQDGAWHHAAGVRIGTNVYLYIDGTLVAQAHGPSSYMDIGGGMPLNIGCWFNGPDSERYFTGDLDDLRIYNRALSGTEVLQLYTMSGGGTLVPNPTLSNVSASQRSGTKLVRGTYTLSGAFATIPVAIMISTNGGASYDINGPIDTAVVPGERKTFSWDMSTAFNNKQCSQMRIRVVAGSAVAESAVFAVDTKNSSRPVVQDVTSPYCDGRQHVYYLTGVPLDQEFTASVDWNGKTPGTLNWLCPERYDGLSYRRTFHVGNWFAGAKLIVVAEASDGTQSLPFTANFDVVNAPEFCPAPLVHDPSKTILTYRSMDDFFVDWFAGGLDSIPGGVPVLGGSFFTLQMHYLADSYSTTVSGNGTARYQLSPAMDFELNLGAIKLRAAPKCTLEWTYDAVRNAWMPTFGEFTVKAKALNDTIESPLVYVAPPIYVKLRVLRMGFEQDVKWEIEGLKEGSQPRLVEKVGDLFFFVEPGLAGTAGCGIAEGLTVEAIATAVGHISVNMHVNDPAQDLELDDAYIVVRYEEKLVFLGFASILKLEETRWPEGQEQEPDRMHAVRANSVSGQYPREFRQLGRDYLSKSTPYSRFLLVPTTRVGSLSWGDVVSPAVPMQLQTNVWAYSEPYVTCSGTNIIILFVTDNPMRSSENRTEVLWSKWNGHVWGNPVSIWNDGTADFSPFVQQFLDGSALAVWQNERTILTNGATLDEAFACMEIAAARYDPTSETWVGSNLTDNTTIDHGPQLAAGSNGQVLLTWISNASNSPSGSASAPNTIYARLWDDSVWQDAGNIATNARMLLWSTVAFDGTNGVYLAAIDGDDDQATIDDQELYGAVYTAGIWSDLARWTTNSIQDTKPQATYDSSGTLLVAWYQGSNLVMRAGDLNLAEASTIGEVGGSSSAKDFRLVTGPAGQISMVWVDVAEDGTVPDPFMLNYDPSLDVWSKPIRILNNTNLLERSFAGAYDENGSLLLAYNQVHIQTDTNRAPIFTNNVVDLMFMDYLIGGDLGVRAADISLSTNSPQPSQTIQVMALVRNLGELAATNITVAFYNGNPAGDGVLIGLSQVVPQLAAGANTNMSVDWTLPESVSNQAIYVVVDPDLKQEDRNRANNTASIMAVQPDLVLSEMSVMNIAAASRIVNARVANEGGIGTGQEFGVSFRRGSTNGPLLADSLIQAMPAGGIFDAGLVWNMEGGAFTTAYETVYALADSGGVVSEGDKDNNVGIVQIMTTLDSDNDGLLDGEEPRYGTSLNVPDSDGDGLKDGEEVNTYGTGPLIPDSDGDGSKDGDEVRAGTDPNSEADVFAITYVNAATGLSVVQWSAKSNKTYQVSRSWELLTWSNAPGGTEPDEQSFQTATTDGQLQYIDIESSSTNRSFYRIDLRE